MDPPQLAATMQVPAWQEPSVILWCMHPPGRRTPQQRAGDAAEDLVADRLVAAGWAILGRRVRAGRGELDLVAIDPGPPAMLAIVEVRWRADRSFGLPEETVTHAKRVHLRKAVARLLAAGHLPGGAPLPRLPVRVDLVAVEPPVRPGERPRIRHHRSILVA